MHAHALHLIRMHAHVCLCLCLYLYLYCITFTVVFGIYFRMPLTFFAIACLLTAWQEAIDRLLVLFYANQLQFIYPGLVYLFIFFSQRTTVVSIV